MLIIQRSFVAFSFAESQSMSVIMRVRFIVFLLLTSSSHASIPASTIDSDAAEINGLNAAVKSSSPAIFRQTQSLVCEMINKCCSDIKPRLGDYLDGSVGGNDALMNACIGKYPRHSLLNNCPTLSKFIPLAQNEDFLKYATTLYTVSREIQNPGINIPKVCSSDEFYAILCDWTEHQKMESCERKRFAYVAQHRSDDDYRTFVRMSKNNLRLMINAIKKDFPTVNVIETTTSSTTVGVKKNLLSSSSSTMQITNKSSDLAQKTAWIFITLLTLLRSVFFC